MYRIKKGKGAIALAHTVVKLGDSTLKNIFDWLNIQNSIKLILLQVTKTANKFWKRLREKQFTTNLNCYLSSGNNNYCEMARS